MQVVHLVGTALLEMQLCSFRSHGSLLTSFWFCPSCNAERCMKSKSFVAAEKRLSVRAVKAAGWAFIGALRRALTEEADGAGAGLPRKGRGKES